MSSFLVSSASVKEDSFRTELFKLSWEASGVGPASPTPLLGDVNVKAMSLPSFLKKRTFGTLSSLILASNPDALTLSYFPISCFFSLDRPIPSW
jgi:hypothetical protein